MRSRPTWEPFSKNRRTVIMSARSEEHTSELQSQSNLVCRLLLEKKKKLQTLQCCLVGNLVKRHGQTLLSRALRLLCLYVPLRRAHCRYPYRPETSDMTDATEVCL